MTGYTGTIDAAAAGDATAEAVFFSRYDFFDQANPYIPSVAAC